MDTFATLVRQRRHELGLSGFKLAVAAGVTPGSVSFWESGKGAPRPKNIRQLAAALQLDARDLAAATVADSATA